MITERQQKLLSAIIKEFIDTAEAVGSIHLLEKYNFKLSSATIRNEMAELVFRGYLYKKHSSAGRIPTTKAWRFFVDKVKSELNYIDASKLVIPDKTREEVLTSLVKVKNEKSDLIRQSINFLSLMSENPTIALIGDDLYYSGLHLLPQIPELKEEDNLQRILKILEDYYMLSDIFNKSIADQDVNILIGEEETGLKDFKNYSVIYSEIRFRNGEKGFLAVVGPNRMRYDKVISSVKYIADTIKFMINN